MQSGILITLVLASTIVAVSSQEWMQNLMMMRMFSGGSPFGSSSRGGYNTVSSQSSQSSSSQGMYQPSQQQRYNPQAARSRPQNNALGMMRMLALTGQMSDNMKRMMCLRPSTMQLCMMMNMF